VLLPWVGAQHARAREIAQLALGSNQSLSNVALALSAMRPAARCRLYWFITSTLTHCISQWCAVAGPALLASAITRCIRCYEDDCEPALTAIAWLDCDPTWHPDTPTLVEACIAHSARVVRQAAWLFLEKHQVALCARWAILGAPCGEAAHRLVEETAGAVYGADNVADLLEDAMVDRDEPDCCE
jgi:hypothetical protein